MVIRVGRGGGLYRHSFNSSGGYVRFLVRVIIIVLFGKWVKRLVGTVDGFTPEVESPINEIASKLVDLGILDNHSPLSRG
jgi:hypothetical protein